MVPTPSVISRPLLFADSVLVHHDEAGIKLAKGGQAMDASLNCAIADLATTLHITDKELDDLAAIGIYTIADATNIADGGMYLYTTLSAVQPHYVGHLAVIQCDG